MKLQKTKKSRSNLKSMSDEWTKSSKSDPLKVFQPVPETRPTAYLPVGTVRHWVPAKSMFSSRMGEFDLIDCLRTGVVSPVRTVSLRLHAPETRITSHRMSE